MGLKKAEEERNNFLRSEARRHGSKLKARELILENLSLEHNQKKELNRLRIVDATQSLERERRRKQEAQDFIMKK